MMFKYTYWLVGFLLISFIACKETPKTTTTSEENYLTELAFDYEADKTITTDSGSVVTAHPLASAVGKDVLQQGGNAIDAAIAVQFTLAVVYPGAGNLGGGGFMI
ncbi:MAG TPA: gamma-glutamyltransferase, partial [Flavobacteriaceae bacterium]|nr:gamma-glutamyltransferase [Flavobacteriaceae bacterium]